MNVAISRTLELLHRWRLQFAGCAYMIAAFSPNIDVANAALPTYITALLFAAGYLLRWHDIPKYWIW